MQVIHIHHPYKAEQIPKDEVALVLGFFDGVHRGHQEVILAGKQEANKRGLKLAVMTFNQHPSIVFQKINPDSMKYLTSIEQKEKHMKELGVDYLYVIEFTSSFASLSPQAFVDQYIVGLHTKIAVAGFDYTYGPREIATMENLPNYANRRFEIVTVAEKSEGNKKISSTNIRQAMDEGNMEEVTCLLGYPYETEGTVVHGEARGRTLGYPTANIQLKTQVRLPKVGVYVVRIKVAKVWYKGMAQIGYNLTFGDNREMTVEVNILDFNKDIYGEQVAVEWCHFLRGEVKFNGREELIQQLAQDEEATREYFKNRK